VTTGRDHVAFACRDRDELQAWAARLDELGIVHGGIKDAHYGYGVSFRDSDGIALGSSRHPPEPRPPSPAISRKPARGAVIERNVPSR
jgi:hypothetical protein